MWQSASQGGLSHPALSAPVPDVINPDAWLSRVKGQHLVRRVNRQGFVKVDLYPYSISSKLAGQNVTLSIQAEEQELQVVFPQEYRRSLPRKQLTSTGPPLSGVS